MDAAGVLTLLSLVDSVENVFPSLGENDTWLPAPPKSGGSWPSWRAAPLPCEPVAKKRQTFGKIQRERERAEKRARKLEKKEEKKAQAAQAAELGITVEELAILEGRAPAEEPEAEPSLTPLNREE